MIFMGEEWGAATPWQFFSDHSAELGRAVSEGRRREFSAHGWAARDIPDPQAPETFEASKLDWSETGSDRGRRLLDWHRRLIELRHREAALADQQLGQASVAYDEQARWFLITRGTHYQVAVAVNLAAQAQTVPVAGELLLASAEPTPDGAGLRLPGESVVIVRLR
jgi:maltooligosyltrehalose trehalohydrolase